MFSMPPVRGSSARTLPTLLLAVAVLALTGCQSDPRPLDDGVAAFDLLVESALQEAREGGASAAQLAILEEATETRAISMESLRASNQLAAECLSSHGFEVNLQDHVTNAGLTVPSYELDTVDVAPELALGLQEGCEYSENYWINKLYWLQPSSIAVTNAHLVRQTPALLECVTRNGGAATEGDDTRAVLDAAQELVISSSGTINCFTEAGIDNY